VRACIFFSTVCNRCLRAQYCKYLFIPSTCAGAQGLNHTAQYRSGCAFVSSMHTSDPTDSGPRGRAKMNDSRTCHYHKDRKRGQCAPPGVHGRGSMELKPTAGGRWLYGWERSDADPAGRHIICGKPAVPSRRLRNSWNASCRLLRAYFLLEDCIGRDREVGTLQQ